MKLDKVQRLSVGVASVVAYVRASIMDGSFVEKLLVGIVSGITIWMLSLGISQFTLVRRQKRKIWQKP